MSQDNKREKKDFKQPRHNLQHKLDGMSAKINNEINGHFRRGEKGTYNNTT